MKVLIIAEPSSLLSLSTLHLTTAALKISSDVDLLLMGDAPHQAAESASTLAGLKKILLWKDSNLQALLPERIAPALLNLARTYTHILAPASTFGKNLMPRLAALLDVSKISDVIKIESDSIFHRPIYAGNGIAVVESFDPIKVMTIRATAFNRSSTQSDSRCPLEELSLPLPSFSRTQFLETLSTPSLRPELSSARIVVSGGRGVQSKENFKIIEELADELGAAIGASRAAVDAGYISNDHQVGQTGKIVAPDLYIAVGISGAIQHLAGMKESKVIVAINKDEEAPIFQISDYGIVGDLFELVPELTHALKGLKTKSACNQ